MTAKYHNSPKLSKVKNGPKRSAQKPQSSGLYDSRLYEGYKQQNEVEYIENAVPDSAIDKVLCKSSEDMSELPDKSIHLVITSPPYNVGKEYDDDLSLDEYRNLIRNVLGEVYRVLVPGGRACINVANVGRRPYIPLHLYLVEEAIKSGFLMRGEIIWNKSTSANSSTAWGSWLSPSNPILRDSHEYILIFSKGTFRRDNPSNRLSTITRDEFLEFTKSVWTFPPESARKIGHPAPFPVELPYRLIQLYTFHGEVVLDPFIGSGSTALGAISSSRHYVGEDKSPKYCSLAENRIADFCKHI